MDADKNIIETEIKDEGRDMSRKSVLFYWALFKSSRDAIMTLEPPSWRFTIGNPAALKIFQAKSETEFTSAEPWRLSPEKQPDGRLSSEKAKEMIEIAMREGTNFFEWTHRRLDGTDFPATVLLTKVNFEGKLFLQATVRDITEIKLAEEKVRESEEKFHSIFDNFVDLYYQTDLNGIITQLSPSCFPLTGWRVEELIGHQVTELYANPEERKALIQKILSNGVVYNYEITLLNHDKKSVLVSVSSHVIKDAQGKLKFIEGTIRDISENKKIEDLLKIKNHELETMNELMIDRELKMIELKKEIKQLKEQLSENKKSDIS